MHERYGCDGQQQENRTVCWDFEAGEHSHLWLRDALVLLCVLLLGHVL